MENKMTIRQISDIQNVLNMLKKSLYWTFDIETTGLNVRSDKIIGFGCANPQNTEDSFYVVMKEFNGTELIDLISDTDVLPIIEALKSKRLITWNGSFDTRFVYHYFNVNLIDSIHADAMLQAHTVNENRMSYALKTIASEILGADSTDSQLKMKESIKANGGSDKEYYKADSNLMATYGLQDNIMTAKLYNIFDKELRQQNLTSFFYTDEIMPLYRLVTIPMELKGVPLDLKLMNDTLAEISLDMEKLHTNIQEAIKPKLGNFIKWYMAKEYVFALSGESFEILAQLIAPSDWPKTKSGSYTFSKAAFKKTPHLLEHDLFKYKSGNKLVPVDLQTKVKEKMYANSGQLYPFNILSKHHLKKLFFEELKEEAVSFTDKGNEQVEDDFLEAMSLKYEWVKWLRTYNKLTKIKSTYIERFLEKQENGVFYPAYFMHRTTSGRFSGDMQQLPRIKTLEDENDELFLKYNNRIRDFFISGPNKKLIDADYSSLEVVVFADDAQDPALMDVILNGHDLYSQVAINVHGLNEFSADKKASNFLKKHKPELRQQAKAFALGFRYNLQPFKLSKDLDIPESEAKRLQREYFLSYPKLKSRMDEIISSAKKTGRVVSKAGRVRRLSGLVENIKAHGEDVLDSLELWKEYGHDPVRYSKMKQIGKECRGAINNSLNFPIQSFAASIVSRASIQIAKELIKRNLKSYICLSCHDEICILSPESEVVEVSVLMRDKMENTTKLSVPLEAEPIIGERYGAVK
jgi:DNA polymerase I-like protein with 3'-5' exonuclease and polymerase domains